ncbi:MAG: polyketide synthase docking domain-containing protein [Verrucomicrobiales bacterium]
MMHHKLIALTAIAAVALLGSIQPATAQAPSPNEDKLREALKAVTLQLRNAESEKAVAQAEKAAADQEIANFKSQTEKMSVQLKALSEEKAIALDNAARTQTDLEARLAIKEAELMEYKKTLEKWQTAHLEISDIAKKKESERAAYAAKSAELERAVADLRSRNTELFSLGNEILERYRNFSFGKALSAREPFTGIMKVKLQNLMQDYQNKLLDQTAKP